MSWQRSACIAPSMEEAEADLAAYLAGRGIDLNALPEEQKAAVTGRFVFGDPDTVGVQLAENLALGVDGFTINMPANGHIPGRVSLLGETVAPLIG